MSPGWTASVKYFFTIFTIDRYDNRTGINFRFQYFLSGDSPPKSFVPLDGTGNRRISKTAFVGTLRCLRIRLAKNAADKKSYYFYFLTTIQSCIPIIRIRILAVLHGSYISRTVHSRLRCLRSRFVLICSGQTGVSSYFIIIARLFAMPFGRETDTAIPRCSIVTHFV